MHIFLGGYLSAIDKPDRISSLDVWRGLAVLAVVLSHFHGPMFFGRPAVDLFFVLSGVLIGGILFDLNSKKSGIKFGRFILRRGFKIWPSYFIYLILSLVLSAVFIAPHYPTEHLDIKDSAPYFLFFVNYDYLPFKYFFMHLWTISVEEHFYLFLPLALMLGRLLNFGYKAFFALIISLIICGVLFKLHNWYNYHGDYHYLYYTATHNRIDSLSYGVLLAAILHFFPNWLKQFKYRSWLFAFGSFILILAIIGKYQLEGDWFRVIWLHHLCGLAFALIIAGTYYSNFKSYHLFRIMGYYSYNWYIWHLWVYFLFTNRGNDILNLLLYLVLSFGVAIFFTVVVEEPFLRLRKRLIS